MLAMARRGKTSIKPLWIIVAIALVAVAFLGSLFFFGATGEPYRSAEELDAKTYLENANSLRGNVYKIQGEVVNALAWSPSSGRLIAVSVNKGEDILPVLVTPQFSAVNIQKGQRFFFLLEVDDKGILRTRNLTKS